MLQIDDTALQCRLIAGNANLFEFIIEFIYYLNEIFLLLVVCDVQKTRQHFKMQHLHLNDVHFKKLSCFI